MVHINQLMICTHYKKNTVVTASSNDTSQCLGPYNKYHPSSCRNNYNGTWGAKNSVNGPISQLQKSFFRLHCIKELQVAMSNQLERYKEGVVHYYSKCFLIAFPSCSSPIYIYRLIQLGMTHGYNDTKSIGSNRPWFTCSLHTC